MSNKSSIVNAAEIAAENTPIVLPLSVQQRQQAFLAGIAELERQFGCAIAAQMKSRALGEVMQIEAQPVVVLIEDWKA